MKNQEKTLSEKRIEDYEIGRALYEEEDVKEFIKALKEKCRENVLFHNCKHFLEEEIDKLAGEKLIK